MRSRGWEDVRWACFAGGETAFFTDEAIGMRVKYTLRNSLMKERRENQAQRAELVDQLRYLASYPDCPVVSC